MGRHYLIRPRLLYIDEQTLDIEYKSSKFLPAVSIRVHVDGCRKDEVCLSYECSAPMSMIISGAIGHFGNKIPCGIDINTNEKRIMVHLDQIDVLEKPLSYVESESVVFYDNHIGVSTRLK